MRAYQSNPSPDSLGYWEEKPSVALSTVVERWCFSVDGKPAPPIRVLPDGQLSMLFSASPGGRGWDATVHGATTRPFTVHHTDRRIQIQIKLSPGYGRGLLDGGARSLRDRSIPLRALWGPYADEILSGLEESKSWATRRAHLERFFPDSQATSRPTARLIRRAVCLIHKDRGRSRIMDIATSLGVERRQLERTFSEHLGLSPKLYARIVRFRATRIRVNEQVPHARLASDAGFSDQAHMTREFRVFGGAPPSAMKKVIPQL